MSSDAASPGSRDRGDRGGAPDWDLPEIRELSIRRVPFRARELKNFTSRFANYVEAIEFLVQTYGPIPARGSGPALFVGDVPVKEGGLVEDNLYQFVALEPDELTPGAPISFGWTDDPPEDRIATRYTFSIDEGEGRTPVPVR
jgi:hypothetical protein